MKGNLEELTQKLNIELINIKVSEELKLKTLEKCKRSERISFHKVFIPITCTLAACLLVGVIVYPIYTKNNIIDNNQITMNASEKASESLDESIIESPRLSNESNIIEGKDSKTYSNEIVDESQKEVNKSIKEPKEEKESKEEKEIIVLNENPAIAFKAKGLVGSEEMDKNISPTNPRSGDTIGNSIIEKEKETKVGSAIALLDMQNNGISSEEETKMNDIPLQEAIKVFGGKIKIPSYVPKGFVLLKVLVPEVDSSSNILYEIVYGNDFQSFKISEYKDLSNRSELDLNSYIQSGVTKENYMVINLNNIAVKYTLSESTDNKEFPYVKLTWENSGRKYICEGNTAWTELINIISSTIN